MLQAAFSGRSKFVYVTPEFVARCPEAIHQLHAAANFCLLALDEAHCVSDMGKGFRAEGYSQLHRLRAPGSPLAALPWMAVTATATPDVQVRSASQSSCGELMNQFSLPRTARLRIARLLNSELLATTVFAHPVCSPCLITVFDHRV